MSISKNLGKICKTLLIAVLLLANGCFMAVYGQNSAVDSLKRELGKHTEEDTVRVRMLLETSTFISNIGKEQSQNYISEAQKIALKLNDNYQLMKTYEYEAIFYRNIDNFGESVKSADKGLEICKKENYGKKDYYKLILRKVLALIRIKKIAETEKLLNELEQNSNYLSQEALANMYSGGFGLLYVEQGKFDKSIESFNKAIEIATKINNKNLVAKCFTTLFVPYFQKGDYEKSIEVSLKAEKMLIDLNNTIALTKVYLNLGLIYNGLKQYDKAIEVNLKNIAKEKELGMPLGNSYTNLSFCYEAKNDYLNYEKYLKMALKEYEKQGNLVEIGQIKGNLGNNYVDRGQYMKAIPLLLESIELLKETNPNDLVVSLTKLAEAYIGVKEYKKATLYTYQAIDLCRKYNEKEVLRANYLLLFRLQMEKFNITTTQKDSIWNYFGLVTNLDDSLAHQKYKESIADKLTKYDTQKKEDSIAIITKETKLLKAENEVKQNQNYLILAVSALLLFIGGFLFYRKTQKAKHELQTKESENKLALQVKENEKVQIKLQEKEAVGQKYGSVSHRLVAGIRQVATDIQDTAPEQAQQLVVIGHSLLTISDVLYPKSSEGLVNMVKAVLAEKKVALANKNILVEADLMDSEGFKQLSPDAVRAFQSCLENAINNVIAHSEATKLEITLANYDKKISFMVVDNGIGRANSVLKDRIGQGLREMPEAMKSIGGVVIEPEVGQGMTLIFEVPI